MEFQKLSEKIKELAKIAIEVKRIRESDPQRDLLDIIREVRKKQEESHENTEE